MRPSDGENKKSNGADPNKNTKGDLAERAADQWSVRIRLWAEKHYGHLPKTRRSAFLDDPRP
jgi:hypothetical protein